MPADEVQGESTDHPLASVLLVGDCGAELEFLKSLLAPLGVRVVSVPSGTEALAKLGEVDFALVLLDSAAPGADDVGSTTPAHARRLGRAPIILLAHDEAAAVGGYARDRVVDVLQKPPDPDILRAKAAVFVDLFRARTEAEAARAHLHDILMQVPFAVTVLEGPDHVFSLVNASYQEIVGPDRDVLGKPVRIALPELAAQGYVELIDRVYRTGEPFFGREMPTVLDRGQGKSTIAYFNFVYAPYRDARGHIAGVTGGAFEVTEQVRARQREAKTRAGAEASEARYRFLAESMPQIVWTARADGTIDYVSGALARYTGKRLDVARQDAWRDIVHPDDLAESTSAWSKAIEAGEPYEREHRLRRTDGAYRWFLARAVPMRAVGAVAAWFGTQTDIHDLKEAEAALRVSEAQFRTFADTMPLLAWYAEPDGRVAWYNRRWFEYTGAPLDARQDWRWESVCDEGELPRILGRWRAALAGGEPWEDQFRLRRHDGVMRWFLSRAQPLRGPDGRIMRWIGTNVDIEDQKRAEEAQRFMAEATAVLASSLDYTATLAAVARLAVPRIADWCAVEVSEKDQSDETTRLAVAHVDPTKVALAEHLRRRYPPKRDAEHGVASVLRSGRSELYGEIPPALLEQSAEDEEHLRLLKALGLRSAMIVPIATRGKTLGAITFAAAESGRLYGPPDLAMAEDLARRASLAIENARLYREAQEANRLKDEFLATVSHELRTPLMAILGWTYLLRSGRSEQVSRAAETIERNARAQARIIDDILDVSRIITGKLRLRLERVNLAEIVRAAVETVQPAAKAKGITLDVALDPNAAEMTGDAGRLEQIVWNLLSNAIKFTPSAGRVGVRLEREASTIRLCVTDTGHGIRADFLPYVFERFRQGDSAPTRAYGGLGLGLAIVRHLVELHGGQVTAESPGEERGATFWVTLPRGI